MPGMAHAARDSPLASFPPPLRATARTSVRAWGHPFPSPTERSPLFSTLPPNGGLWDLPARLAPGLPIERSKAEPPRSGRRHEGAISTDSGEASGCSRQAIERHGGRRTPGQSGNGSGYGSSNKRQAVRKRKLRPRRARLATTPRMPTPYETGCLPGWRTYGPFLPPETISGKHPTSGRDVRVETCCWSPWDRGWCGPPIRRASRLFFRRRSRRFRRRSSVSVSGRHRPPTATLRPATTRGGRARSRGRGAHAP
jgi:hypothetical protein